MKTNIAIYGWAFNPPHLWHKNIVKEVLNSSCIDKIILTPDWERLDKSYWISYSDKLKLIELFFENLKNEWLNIELDTHFLEWKNNWYTNTVNVDEYFKDKLGYSPYHIFWIDVIPDIKYWSWNKDSYIERILKKIIIERPWYVINTRDIENFNLVEQVSENNISSSMVREEIKENKLDLQKTLNRFLIPEIVEYILEKKLYFKEIS